MTKVALCMSGKIGNTKGKSGHHESEFRVLKKGYDHYKKHLLDTNDVDVFIHCWDGELEQEVQDLIARTSACGDDAEVAGLNLLIRSCLSFRPIKGFSDIRAPRDEDI